MKDGIGPYRIPDIRVTSTLVYTNKVRGTQLRGLGVPEGSWAIESQMDMIAARLGMDPLELRLKNILREGDINSIGDAVQSIGLRECLEKVAVEIGWRKPKAKNVGRGLAVIAKSPTTHSSISGAHVLFNEDGSAQIMVGASEIGQGMCVVLSQIAAEELGISVEAVGITCADTGATPYDRGTFSSRVTFYTGMAVKKAAEDAKRQLFETASRMLEIPASDLAVEDERVVSMRQPQASLSLREVLEHAHNREKPILGRGWYGGKGDYPSLPHKAQGKEYVPGWKYAAQAVEVEIDEETGMIKVKKIASAHDVGTTLNPTMVKGQIVGGVVMGLGYALHERLQFEDGRVINPSFMKRLDAIKAFVRVRTDEICICGVGVNGRELYSVGHHPLNLYNVNMPYPLALSFGIALAIPQRRTILLDGDGSLLSGCSTLSVIGNVRPKNLLIVVWDNESFVTPYGLPTPTAGFTNLETVVKGMGIPKAKTVRSLDEFEGALKEMLGACLSGLPAQNGQSTCSPGDRGGYGAI